MATLDNNKRKMIGILRIMLVIFNLNFCYPQEIIKKGPFIMPDWKMPQFSEFVIDTNIEVIIYPDAIKATLMSSRAWRSVLDWSFLARYDPHLSGYVSRPNAKEAEEWAEKNQCKVGKTYETSGDNKCWEDLGSNRNVWIDSKVLKMEPPGRRGWRSTCSTYWSCDIKPVSFPVYVNEKGDPYFSGPMGDRLEIVGNGESKVIPVKDSVLLFKTIKRIIEVTRINARCQVKVDVDTGNPDSAICSIIKDDKQIITSFTKTKTKYSFNNMLFLIPNLKRLYSSLMRTKYFSPMRAPIDDSSSATIGDLKQLEKRLVLTSNNLVFEYHNIVKELVEVKHAIRELIMSAAKIDDTLIGRIVSTPVRTTWLSKNVFLLGSRNEDMLYEDSNNMKSTCEGSYVYENGRWKLPDKAVKCMNWSDVSVLDILNNHVFDPLDLKDAPEYRQSHTEYTGWSFLDDGKASLDWLDPNLKYKKKGSGLTDIFGDFDFLKIFSGINSIIIIAIILFLIVSCCRK